MIDLELAERLSKAAHPLTREGEGPWFTSTADIELERFMRTNWRLLVDELRELRAANERLTNDGSALLTELMQTCEARISDVLSERDEARAMLKKHEYSGMAFANSTAAKRCPECHGISPESRIIDTKAMCSHAGKGHAPDCELAKLLTRARDVG